MHGIARIQNAENRKRLEEKKRQSKREQYKSEKKVRREKNYEEGTRAEIVRLLLMQGVIPKYSLRIYKDYPRYYSMINTMIAEGLLRETLKYGCRFITFNSNYNALIDNCLQSETNQKYTNYFFNYIGVPYGELERVYSQNKQEIKRLYTMSYMRPYLKVAGISTMYEERESQKVTLQTPQGESEEKYLSSPPIYFTAPEIKRWKKQKKKQGENALAPESNKSLNSSRAVGVVISEGGSYQLYNLLARFNGKKTSLIKWSTISEQRMAEKISQYRKEIIKETALEESESKFKIKTDALVFVEEMDIATKIYENKGDKILKGYIQVDSTFDNFFILPLSIEGISHFKQMLTRNWAIELHKTIGLKYEDVQRVKTGGLECSGVIQEETKEGIRTVYVLNMLIPEMNKLKAYASGSELIINPPKEKDAKTKRQPRVNNSNKAFRVYCYKYQREFLEKILNPKIEIIEVKQPML